MDTNRLPLQRGKALVLGRGRDCDVQIDHGSVSRHHARIVCNEDGWLIEDLASTHGVSINDTYIVGLSRLRDTDLIQIGFVFLRFVTTDDDVFDSDPGDSGSGAPLLVSIN